QDAAADGAAAVLFDELVEVALALGLEVGVVGWRRLERMQQEGGKPDRLAHLLFLGSEGQRMRGRTDEGRRGPRGALAVVDVDEQHRDVVGRSVIEALLDEAAGRTLRRADGAEHLRYLG